MIKSLVNQFIKNFRNKSFEDSTVDLIILMIKKKFPDIKVDFILPVVFASVTGKTITMSVKLLKKKGFEVYSNKTILDCLATFDANTTELIVMETRNVLLKVAKL